MLLVEREPDKGYIDVNVWLPKSAVNVPAICAALTFTTADEEAKFIYVYKETEHHLVVPREFWIDNGSIPFVDLRPQTYPHADITSSITLDVKYPNETTQRDAVAAMLSSRGGVVQVACGGGKSVIALEAIARSKQPALILVDSSQLLRQWRKLINNVLKVPGGVGLIQGPTMDWNKSIVLGTYQSLALKAHLLPPEARRHFRWIIWDEGHHLPAPTYSLMADTFYGTRILLTATPNRSDGRELISTFHVGNVIYKNLRQKLTPQIIFKRTGYAIEMLDPHVKAEVSDFRGELHISRLYTYMAKDRDRLQIVIDVVKRWYEAGKKVLYLSWTVDELVNLLALWNGLPTLYSEVPYPTLKEIGEEDAPVHDGEYVPAELKKHELTIAQLKLQLGDKNLAPHARINVERMLKHHEMKVILLERRKRLDKEYNRRRRAYLADLLAMPSTAGLMIHAVDEEDRERMFNERKVTFAIFKYGREGLDSPDLEVVVAGEPMSDPGMIQQFMGRVLREIPGQYKLPTVVFMEDSVGLLIGMCRNIRHHLREWPEDAGGPFEFQLEG